MATGHPVDGEGRALPPCGWPADRAAPGALEDIRRFCNTTNLESGADRLTTPAGLDGWLVEQGHAAVDASADELDRVVACREQLRAQAVAQREGRPITMDPIAASIGPVPLRLGARDGVLAVEPDAPSGTDRFLAGLALAVVEAVRLGTWRRLKACRTCSWVFYDGSKNRSGQWCSMSACGGRAKVRSFRARQRSR